MIEFIQNTYLENLMPGTTIIAMFVIPILAGSPPDLVVN